MCVCVCVCVCERERERERFIDVLYVSSTFCSSSFHYVSFCVVPFCIPLDALSTSTKRGKGVGRKTSSSEQTRRTGVPDLSGDDPLSLVSTRRYVN